MQVYTFPHCWYSYASLYLSSCRPLVYRSTHTTPWLTLMRCLLLSYIVYTTCIAIIHLLILFYVCGFASIGWWCSKQNNVLPSCLRILHCLNSLSPVTNRTLSIRWIRRWGSCSKGRSMIQSSRYACVSDQEHQGLNLRFCKGGAHIEHRFLDRHMAEHVGLNLHRPCAYFRACFSN